VEARAGTYMNVPDLIASRLGGLVACRIASLAASSGGTGTFLEPGSTFQTHSLRASAASAGRIASLAPHDVGGALWRARRRCRPAASLRPLGGRAASGAAARPLLRVRARPAVRGEVAGSWIDGAGATSDRRGTDV